MGLAAPLARTRDHAGSRSWGPGLRSQAQGPGSSVKGQGSRVKGPGSWGAGSGCNRGLGCPGQG
eukprot:3209067-Rhodomonas_salina.4